MAKASQRGHSRGPGGAEADPFDYVVRKALFFVLSVAIAGGGVWFVVTGHGESESNPLAAAPGHAPYHTVQVMVCVKASNADMALQFVAGCLRHMNVRERPFTIPLADGRMAVCVGRFQGEDGLKKAGELVELCRAFRLHPEKPARFPEARTVRVEPRIGDE
jgi:hypothetical protein